MGAKSIIKDNVNEALMDAMHEHNEPLMQDLIVQAMRIYLGDGVDYTRESLMEALETADYNVGADGHPEPFKFHNAKLRYVFYYTWDSLYDRSDADFRKVVQKLLEYLIEKE